MSDDFRAKVLKRLRAEDEAEALRRLDQLIEIAIQARGLALDLDAADLEVHRQTINEKVGRLWLFKPSR